MSVNVRLVLCSVSSKPDFGDFFHVHAEECTTLENIVAVALGGKLFVLEFLRKTFYFQIQDSVGVHSCAGLILLADNLSNDSHSYFGTLPATVERNAYGRQLGSFYAEGVQVLAIVNNQIVAVRYKNQLAISFHPELNEDLRVHQYFLKIVSNSV